MVGAITRVLIVEDDRDTADSFALLLKVKGYNARACYTGKECLACLDEFRPQVIMLDLAMPKVTGFDLAQQIRGTAQHKDIPLVALTGYGQPSDRQQTREAGFAFHLLKPAKIEQVEEALRSVAANANG
jgi:CheY-like chemotaxis protein